MTKPMPRGADLLHDPTHNKGLAFTEEEREALGLRGLLPPRVQSQDTQVVRVMGNLRRKNSDLERYIFLMGLQDRNERLFYRVTMEHLTEIMPIIYTPTVGEASQLYGHIFRRPRGLYVSADDRGRVEQVLRNWPCEQVRIVVVTDGGRVLGLGDLGAAGMAIPVGKLILYTACAGIPPDQCLPVTLDVGTDNEALLRDPLYIGLPRRRLRGPAYDGLLEEFLSAVTSVFPSAVVQLEDFANENAFRLLGAYKDRLCLFDDDIQGTGSVVLAGFLSALRITGSALHDQRILFLGAGEAGIGIADLIVAALVEEGMSQADARQRCWFVDSKGLVVSGRTDLNAHKRVFAHDHPSASDLLAILASVRPTALIGVSGVQGLISPAACEAMAAQNERPIIFALSNPTSRSECTAHQAYAATGGRAVFASGSPFGPVVLFGRTYVPGQANNAYIFPGVGLGAIACGARRAPDMMFFQAARVLADAVTETDLALGRIYPPLSRIREVSASIAAAAAEVAYGCGIARVPRPADLLAHIRSLMYRPDYPLYV